MSCVVDEEKGFQTEVASWRHHLCFDTAPRRHSIEMQTRLQ